MSKRRTGTGGNGRGLAATPGGLNKTGGPEGAIQGLEKAEMKAGREGPTVAPESRGQKVPEGKEEQQGAGAPEANAGVVSAEWDQEGCA